jgi:hypothetical protein
LNLLGVALGVLLAWSYAGRSGYHAGWLAFAILISLGGAFAVVRELRRR